MRRQLLILLAVVCGITCLARLGPGSGEDDIRVAGIRLGDDIATVKRLYPQVVEHTPGSWDCPGHASDDYCELDGVSIDGEFVTRVKGTAVQVGGRSFDRNDLEEMDKLYGKRVVFEPENPRRGVRLYRFPGLPSQLTVSVEALEGFEEGIVLYFELSLSH